MATNTRSPGGRSRSVDAARRRTNRSVTARTRKSASRRRKRPFPEAPTNRHNSGQGRKRDIMRVFIFAAVLGVLPGVVLAQQPPSAQALKTFASSADVAALMAKAKATRKPDQANLVQPLLQLAPYTANLESRAGVANAAVHEKEA